MTKIEHVVIETSVGTFQVRVVLGRDDAGAAVVKEDLNDQQFATRPQAIAHKIQLELAQQE